MPVREPLALDYCGRESWTVPSDMLLSFSSSSPVFILYHPQVLWLSHRDEVTDEAYNQESFREPTSLATEQSLSIMIRERPEKDGPNSAWLIQHCLTLSLISAYSFLLKSSQVFLTKPTKNLLPVTAQSHFTIISAHTLTLSNLHDIKKNSLVKVWTDQ